MKLKVFFLKKKHIYAAIAILIMLILLIILLSFNSKNTISTFNIISSDKLFKTDLTGDGEEDILYIKTDKDKYYIQVNTKNNKNIFIEPNKKLNTVGTYIKYWPMRLTLKDISRDNIPEIFIQSSQKTNQFSMYFYGKMISLKIYCVVIITF
ncbi:hypothetical protein ACFIJ5_05290 [Haloimpatiens sp. FM7330]|uniref:hypothetical protein n=1 Tax=Haloimpatiens sp. FM7330 TaxID=3298610 RepID=UPI003636E460